MLPGTRNETSFLGLFSDLAHGLQVKTVPTSVIGGLRGSTETSDLVNSNGCKLLRCLVEAALPHLGSRSVRVDHS